ncbi:MAG: hypothetical protein NT169_13680 [Chloroflexi bacterium]|nr:hypothetical protein [Chloroflexota bacterium]
MTIDAAVAWPRVNRRQKQVRARKDEAPARSADVGQADQALDRPVATYVMEGEEYVITAGEVVAVRERLARPYSDESLYELIVADKLAERNKRLPKQELRRRLQKTIEAIRAEAIAKGSAIDDPMEAVVGD